MKGNLFRVISALVFTILLPFTLASAQDIVPCENKTITLSVGKGKIAGTVTAFTDGSRLYIKFITSGGWRLKKTMLAIALKKGGIPHNEFGTLMPGSFRYKKAHASARQYIYSIKLPYRYINRPIYVAAYANLNLRNDKGVIVRPKVDAWAYSYAPTAKLQATFFKFTPSSSCGSVYLPGTDHLVLKTSLPDTGTLEVISSGTPLDGVRIAFPDGAVPKGTEVSLGYNNGILTPKLGQFSGTTLSLKLEGIEKFDAPATITAPFDGSPDSYPLPYYIDEQGSLYPLPVMEINRDSKEFSFQILHASWYSWIINTAHAPGPDDSFDTGFRPETDGFKVGNDNNSCFGLSYFSQWYFIHEKKNKGSLYGKYYNNVNYCGFTQSGESVIGKRAQQDIATRWPAYRDIIVNSWINKSDKANYSQICDSMKNTGKPVMIYLWSILPTIDDFHSHVCHQVLAYKYDIDGKIYIYDPNRPGEDNYIQYDSSNERIEYYYYNIYNILLFGGDGNLDIGTSFNEILNNAEAGFPCSDQTWKKKADFPGTGEREPLSVATSQKGYIGNTSTCEFWEYDPKMNAWSQKANLPGDPYNGFQAPSFVINDKVYVVIGNETWQYDPDLNLWSVRNSIPGEHKRGGFAFALNGKGYLGGGYYNGKSFWVYDPNIDKWTQKDDHPCFYPYYNDSSHCSIGDITFTIGEKAYLTGTNLPFWEYNPVSETWLEKAYVDAVYATAFAINNKGYVVNTRGDVYEYLVATNSWILKPGYSGSKICYPAGFAIQGKGYVGVGGRFEGNTCWTDAVNEFWEFTP